MNTYVVFAGLAAIAMACLHLLHRWAFKHRYRYHNWYCRWIARPLIVNGWWRLIGRTTCSCCGQCVKKSRLEAHLCPECGFDEIGYQRAECRCWIRDEIAPISSQVDRALWCARNERALWRAAELLNVRKELLTREITQHGRVVGLVSNRSTAGR